MHSLLRRCKAYRLEYRSKHKHGYRYKQALVTFVHPLHIDCIQSG